MHSNTELRQDRLEETCTNTEELSEPRAESSHFSQIKVIRIRYWLGAFCTDTKAKMLGKLENYPVTEL